MRTEVSPYHIHGLATGKGRDGRSEKKEKVKARGGEEGAGREGKPEVGSGAGLIFLFDALLKLHRSGFRMLRLSSHRIFVASLT